MVRGWEGTGAADAPRSPWACLCLCALTATLRGALAPPAMPQSLAPRGGIRSGSELPWRAAGWPVELSPPPACQQLLGSPSEEVYGAIRPPLVPDSGRGRGWGGGDWPDPLTPTTGPWGCPPCITLSSFFRCRGVNRTWGVWGAGQAREGGLAFLGDTAPLPSSRGLQGALLTGPRGTFREVAQDVSGVSGLGSWVGVGLCEGYSLIIKLIGA